MPDTPADKPPASPRHTVRWWDSLLVRVLLLCCVLVLCLLGSVLIITRYFYKEAVEEMEARTNEIVHTLSLDFDQATGDDIDTIETRLMEMHEGFDLELTPFSGDAEPTSYTLTGMPNGSITRVAEVPVQFGDVQLMLTARMTIVPQVEIMRAFTSRYMIVLTCVFLLALGLMLYFIARALQPLSRLTESCAAISSGNLQTVRTDRATGEIRALEATFNDMVTSLREKEMMESKLRQAQRLSALGNLAAGVAHDVRNPLNAIKLLSSHALDSIEGDEKSRAAKPLETIRREVDRLEEIVSSFLSLAKERSLEAEPSRVDDLLEECVRLFQKDAEARGVRLTMELRATDVTLLLDPKQFNRAILNVLLNALEACSPGGRVRMFSRVVDIGCQIEIRDDGPGLDTEAADRVFDPYYTTKPGGTGLGLSITRGIIEEHGGTVELTSTPKQGAQVLVTLPLEPPESLRA